MATLRRDRARLIRLVEQEQQRALHDLLTGLPNLRAFEEHMGLILARAARAGTAVCIGYVDLDKPASHPRLRNGLTLTNARPKLRSAFAEPNVAETLQ